MRAACGARTWHNMHAAWTRACAAPNSTLPITWCSELQPPPTQHHQPLATASRAGRSTIRAVPSHSSSHSSTVSAMSGTDVSMSQAPAHHLRARRHTAATTARAGGLGTESQGHTPTGIREADGAGGMGREGVGGAGVVGAGELGAGGVGAGGVGAGGSGVSVGGVTEMDVDEGQVGQVGAGGGGAGGRGEGEEVMLEVVLRYHETSKHHLGRYAKGPGRLDWASQPDPFRRYDGAPLLPLPRHTFQPDEATASSRPSQRHTRSHKVPHTSVHTEPHSSSPHSSHSPSHPLLLPLWDAISLPAVAAVARHSPAGAGTPSQPVSQPVSLASVSQLLYYSLALSGWKAAGGEAWSLRVNPSSGNLHPTEAHLLLPPMGPEVAGGTAFIAHYAPREHGLEVRGQLPPDTYAHLTRQLPCGGAHTAAAGNGPRQASGGGGRSDVGGAVGGGLMAGGGVGYGRGVVVVCLSSVLWREAWKYGERAYRYCTLDVGHALAALTTSARLLGWHASLIDTPTTQELATLFNLPQPPYQIGMDAAAAAPQPTRTTTTHPESEHPDCLVALWPAVTAVTASGSTAMASQCDLEPAAVAEAVARTMWVPATANRLSSYHYGGWPAVEQVAAATACYSRAGIRVTASASVTAAAGTPLPAAAVAAVVGAVAASGRDAHAVIRGRRSAVSFDAAAVMSQPVLLRLLWALTPRGPAGNTPTSSSHPHHSTHQPDPNHHHPCLEPAVVGGMGSGGRPGVSVLLMVHRVQGVEPGLYCLIRNPAHMAALKPRTRPFPSHAWDRPAWCPKDVPLYRLASGDCRELAQSVSCSQEIASDCCVAMAMLAELGGALSDHGPHAYARLHWECGALGQAVYLEAEASGLGATGIGCFADDPSARLANVEPGDYSYQTMYHIAVGGGVSDSRVASLSAYHHLTQQPDNQAP